MIGTINRNLVIVSTIVSFFHIRPMSVISLSLRLVFIAIFIVNIQSAYSQNKKDPPKDKKNLLDKVSELPDILISQKEVSDTNAHRFVQDILSIEVPPVWKEKGTMLLNDLKLNKTDKEPLNGTLPLPEKKIVNSLILTLNTIKKTPAERKAMAIAQVKAHIATCDKAWGTSRSISETEELLNTMIIGPETFTTRQGRSGDLYLIHDIQPQQSSLILLLLVQGPQPNSVHFAQIQFQRFIYETTPPDEVMEWRTFIYPDEQQTYIDFGKKMFQTLLIR